MSNIEILRIKELVNPVVRLEKLYDFKPVNNVTNAANELCVCVCVCVVCVCVCAFTLRTMHCNLRLEMSDWDTNMNHIDHRAAIADDVQ